MCSTEGGARPCLKHAPRRQRQGPRAATRSTTNGCCSSRATASRCSTSSCRPRSRTRAGCSPGSPASGSRGRRTSSRTTCSRSGRTAARPSAAGSRCCRSSASCAATSRAPAGRTTRRRAGLRASAARRASSSRRSSPSRSSRRRRRRQTGHDEPLDRERAVALVGEERFDELEATRRSGSTGSRRTTRARGIILADTKLEFGLDDGGQVVLGDEAFTPDSSRFWPAEGYQPGGAQPSFDKQYVRDYCRGARLGQDGARPRASGRGRRRHARALPRGVRAADRHPVLGVLGRPAGRAQVKVSVLVRPKAGILDPQGAGGRGIAAQARLRGQRRPRRDA